jgi:hypothetical protein
VIGNQRFRREFLGSIIILGYMVRKGGEGI